VYEEKGQRYLLRCPECWANASTRRARKETYYLNGLNGIKSHFGQMHKRTHDLFGKILDSAMKMTTAQERAYLALKMEPHGQSNIFLSSM
jgi:hypothetical protein